MVVCWGTSKVKYIDEYIRTKITKVIELGKPMPTGGFWCVYAACSSRLSPHTHSLKPHTHLMAILLSQKKVQTQKTVLICRKHLVRA